MSLTSYRAAPPRVKPLRALRKYRCRNGPGERPLAPIDPVRRLPEKATRAEAIGCGRYVSMPACFGKAQRPVFEVFVTGKTQVLQPKIACGNRPCHKPPKSGALPATTGRKAAATHVAPGHGGNTRDRYIRFRGGGRGLRRLRGGRAAFGRSGDLGGAAGCRWQKR